MTGSYDPETNLTFWGVGNPGPDWNGDGRLGDNLYSCSVIALDADTGKLKWHYQFSPHNEFDWDSVQVPVLADFEWNGRPRKLMLWVIGSGVFYVLDRTTGEFLLGKPFAKTNWVAGFDGERKAHTHSRRRSDEGRHPGLSGKPGRHQLVQPVVQPKDRSFLYPHLGEQLDHLFQGSRTTQIFIQASRFMAFFRR